VSLSLIFMIGFFMLFQCSAGAKSLRTERAEQIIAKINVLGLHVHGDALLVLTEVGTVVAVPDLVRHVHVPDDNCVAGRQYF